MIDQNSEYYLSNHATEPNRAFNNYIRKFLTNITFWSFNSVLRTGSQQTIQLTDLPPIEKEEQSKYNSNEFLRVWDSELHRHEKPSLFKAIHKVYSLRFYLAGLLKIGYDLTQLVSPIFVQKLIRHLQNRDKESDSPLFWGLFLALALLIVQVIGSLLLQQYFNIVISQGRRIKTGLMTAIYRKSLRLGPLTKSSFSNGDIITYFSSDTTKVGSLLKNLHMTWSSILQIVFSVTMLYSMLGWPCVVGMSLWVISIPFCLIVTRVVRKIKASVLTCSGKRKSVLSEIIQGMKTIKMNVWEEAFKQKVSDIREVEISKMKIVHFTNSVTNSLMAVSPIFVAIISFSVFATSDSPLDSTIIFPCLSYLNMLRAPTTFFPSIMSSFVDAKVSLDRIERFLWSQEVECSQPNPYSNEVDTSVKIENGWFYWKESIPDQKPSSKVSSTSTSPEELQTSQPSETTIPLNKTTSNFSLRNINLSIRRGDFVVIMGPVGCGKSSLLSSILGEMNTQKGKVSQNGSLVFLPQQPWLQDLSVRENILFGNEINEQKYNTVIESCSLNQDLESLSHGEFTQVGERGVQLSGGQKQRVSLARAVYSNADIYLFDEPLSALDQTVSDSVFQNCICGVLSGKTRILVTNQIQHATAADLVVFMKDGEIVDQISAQEERFRQVILNCNIAQAQKVVNTPATQDQKKKEKTKINNPNNEEKSDGGISAKIFKGYLEFAGGNSALFSILVLYTISQTLQSLTSWFLTFWLKKSAQHQAVGNSHPFNHIIYIGVYSGIGFASACIVLLCELVVTAFGLKAAKGIHNTAFDRLMQAPMLFFDTTPSGRIINRFSGDVETTDNSLISTVKSVMGSLFPLLGTLVMISIIVPWFLIPVVPTIIIYWKTQQYYTKSSCEIKRLISVTRSPLLSHFIETLQGQSVIRTMGKDGLFSAQNEDLIDQNNLTYYSLLTAQRWIALRLKLLSTCIVFFTSLSCLIGSTPTELVGLCLSYALAITTHTEWFVRHSTDLEAEMNSVERLLYYCEELPQENLKHDRRDELFEVNQEPLSTTCPEWPRTGDITFSNVCMKYSPQSEQVLHNLSIRIQPGQKIGVIGRTGSGKSSLMSLIFSLTDPCRGKMFIDGVDIRRVSLKRLRSSISAVPQEPFMFSGTLRNNLDPLHMYEDWQIWKVLEKAHCKDLVLKLLGQLDYQVSEFGNNFSIGERQLLCIGRALLKKSPIVIMDEATSNLDAETEKLILATFKNEFQDSGTTVISIAHRISTINNSDILMVMNEGTLVGHDLSTLKTSVNL